MKGRALIIDDDATICRLFDRALREQDFECDMACTIAESRAQLGKQTYDVILLDMVLPDGNGVDWLPDAKEAAPDSVIVVITGYGDIPDAVRAMQMGADHFLTKPIKIPELQVILGKCLELRKLRRSSAVSHRLAPVEKPFFGNSPRARSLLEIATVAAAQKDSHVLIRGETGTGKGLMARWIHNNSPLREGPFVEVRCSASRGRQLASELFGHAKGAYLAATTDKMGLLEAADGGTLHMDEIGDLDYDMQSQFLTVIEQKIFRRMGDARPRSSDFRLITSTNQDLEYEISKERFRRDLYYRINVFPIEMPPLRDLRDDIPDIVRYLLNAMRANPPQVSENLLERFREYSWPGNIREMKNVLERALTLAGGEEITEAHCPGLVVPGMDGLQENALNLQDIEKVKIAEALENYKFDVTKAAEALGISRATLYRKIKVYRLPRKPRGKS